MSYSVRFDRPSFRLSRGRRLNYLGKGHLHLQETGLVLDGNLLKFRLPVIDRFYHPIISAPSTRTIPYSTITGHRQLSYWPTRVGKGLLLLILLAVLSALVFGLVRGGNWIAIGISLAVVAGLIVLTCLIGRRFQRIVFGMPDGKSCRVIFSTRSRQEGIEFARELAQYMAAAESIRQKATPSPQPETKALDLAPPSAESETGVGDGATPRLEQREDRPATELPSQLATLFEVRCPSCGRPRKILNAAMIGRPVACLECETEYVIQPPERDVAGSPEAASTEKAQGQRGPESPRATEPPSDETEYRLMEEPRPSRARTAREGPPSGLRGERPATVPAGRRPVGAPTTGRAGVARSSGRRSRLGRLAKSLLVFLLWTVAGALVCLLIHLGLQSRVAQRHLRSAPVLGWAASTFYYPGTQLHALWLDVPAKDAESGWRGRVRPYLPAACTIVFWALICGFLGWFSRTARPEAAPFGDRPEAFWKRWLRSAGVPVDHLGEARVWLTLAVWLVALGGVVVLGLLGRELVQRQAEKTQQRTDQKGKAWGGSGFMMPGGGWTRYPAYDGARAEWVTELKSHLKQGQELTEQGRHPEAQQHYEKALVLLRKLRPRMNRDTAVVHHNLALNLHQQGKHPQAAKHYEEALEILLGIGQGQSREAALVYSSYARNLDGQGKHDEARGHYEKALAIVQGLVGEEHPDTAVVQMGLAQHLDQQGKPEEARPHFDQAVKVLLAQPEPAKVQEKATCLLGSGANLLVLGRHDEAKDQLAKAWKMARSALGDGGLLVPPAAAPPAGPDSPTSALKDHLERGRQLDERGKHFDAQGHYQEALDLVRDSRRALEGSVPLVLNMLETAAVHHLWAQSLQQQGRYVKAGEHYDKALETLAAVGKAESQEAAMLHNNWAQSYDERNKPAEARARYEKALAIAGSFLGGGHPDTALVQMNLGQHLDLQGEHQEARPHHDKAVEILLAQPEGSRDRQKAMCLLGSGHNLLALGRYGEARRHAGMAGSIARTAFGDGDRLAAMARGLQVQTLGVPIAKYSAWVIILLVALVIAWHAGRRGYSTLLWLVATLVSAYPLANLAVLASLGNRARQIRRANISRQVEGLIDQAAIRPESEAAPGRTIGDQTTQIR